MLYYAEFFHTPHKVLLIPQAALIIADVLSASELALLITLYCCFIQFLHEDCRILA